MKVLFHMAFDGPGLRNDGDNCGSGFNSESSTLRPSITQPDRLEPNASTALGRFFLASSSLGRPLYRTVAIKPSLGWSRSRGNDAFQGERAKKSQPDKGWDFEYWWRMVDNQ
jgi:hypothetical protein